MVLINRFLVVGDSFVTELYQAQSSFLRYNCCFFIVPLFLSLLNGYFFTVFIPILTCIIIHHSMATQSCKQMQVKKELPRILLLVIELEVWLFDWKPKQKTATCCNGSNGSNRSMQPFHLPRVFQLDFAR